MQPGNQAAGDGRTRILLVDDDSDSLMIMEHILDQRHYDITWCADPDGAGKALAREDFDVCLLDYRLGGTNGLELLSQLRGAGCDVPIILYTGQQDVEVEREAARRGADDYLSKDELSASTLDRMLYFAIERRRGYAELVRMARTDSLTGAANRNAMQGFISQAMGRARRHERQFAVLVLDLDHFKAINDERGHAFGDAVLVNLVAIVQRSIRESDLVARVGGDEFVVVLDDIASVEGAHSAARTIREKLRAGFRQDDEIVPIRASIGVGIWPQDGETIVELLAAADRSMYRDKRANRGGHTIRTPAETANVRGLMS